MDKETDALWNSALLGYSLINEALCALAYNKCPLSNKRLKKIRESIAKSLDIVINEPGSVVKIECNDYSEAIATRWHLKELLPKIKRLTLREDLTTETQFEFTNNSAILITKL